MTLVKRHSESSTLGTTPTERSIADYVKYGVFVMDKPEGPTSHEAAAFVKKILKPFGVDKTGHSGTLDNNVSGVLPTFIQDGTKAVTYVAGGRKVYVCALRCHPAQTYQQLDEAFENFRGKIYQTPPEASAVVKKLRIREIFSLKLLEVSKENPSVSLFEADVEAGTYIRNLCRDVGDVLGINTEMAQLRRTVAAGITEHQAHSLQTLSDAVWLYQDKGDESELRRVIRPLEEFIHLPQIIVSDDAIKPITTGANLALPGVLAYDSSIKKDDDVSLVSGKGEILAFAKALMDAKEFKAEKGLCADVSRVVKVYKNDAPN